MISPTRDLLAAREERGEERVALVRVERLYPFPEERIVAELERYAHVPSVVWCQEEPRNMGAWAHMLEAFGELLSGDRRLAYVGRSRAASPATGSKHTHLHEQKTLIEAALSL